MSSQKANYYHIPLAYRRMENLHIVFWLFKDIAWCMFWKPLGIAMIIPTLLISIIISWRTRKVVSELCHNLAITVWITANSFWMCTEFFGVDHIIIYQTYSVKHLAVIPSFIGVLILAYYYILYMPKHRHDPLTL